MDRKIILIIITFFTITFSSSRLRAQIFIDEHFGFFAGITISNFTGDETIGERDSRTGFNIGGYYKFPMNKAETISIMPEMLAVSKGGIFYTPQYGYAEFILQYIELPVFFLVENRRRMSFHIGPYLGLLVNANGVHYRFGEISTSDFSTFDFGGTAGFRARIDRYFLGLDFSGGMVQIGKTKLHEGENFDLVGNSRNLTMMIYAGVFF